MCMTLSERDADGAGGDAEQPRPGRGRPASAIRWRSLARAWWWGRTFDDTGAINAGSAYVYDLSSGTPTVPVATLNNPGPAANDFFGSSVAISGARVVVGAYVDGTPASHAGSAYVYDLSGGTPTAPVARLNNPNPTGEEDAFGSSVAISGTRVMVGAYSDDTGAIDAGSAYLYDMSSADADSARGDAE